MGGNSAAQCLRAHWEALEEGWLLLQALSPTGAVHLGCQGENTQQPPTTIAGWEHMLAGVKKNKKPKPFHIWNYSNSFPTHFSIANRYPQLSAYCLCLHLFLCYEKAWITNESQSQWSCSPPVLFKTKINSSVSFCPLTVYLHKNIIYFIFNLANCTRFYKM